MNWPITNCNITTQEHEEFRIQKEYVRATWPGVINFYIFGKSKEREYNSRNILTVSLYMTWTPFIIPTCDWIIATACEKCIPRKEKCTPIYKPTNITYMQYYCGQRGFFVLHVRCNNQMKNTVLLMSHGIRKWYCSLSFCKILNNCYILIRSSNT